MVVRCGMGLGNRVAAIANGLSRADAIQFAWRENEHCPARHEDVFPGGIPGVEFVRIDPPAMATRWDGAWCYEWHAAADRDRAREAYATVMRSMVGEPDPDAPDVAIFGRFHRNPAGRPEHLVDAATKAEAKRVFLLSDLHRDKVAAGLVAAGIEVLFPICRSLRADLDRSVTDIEAYAADWKTMLAAGQIIALDGPASALHPARAARIEIIYA